MSQAVDVAIIGASIAGTSLAINLAQQNLNSVIIDQNEFPRQKACGDGLSILGIRELRRLGIEVPPDNAPHYLYRGFDFIDKKKHSKVELFDSSSAKHHGVGIQRSVLDNILHTSLKKFPDSQLLTACKPIINELSDGHFSIQTEAGCYKSRYLVLATGSISKLPQLLGVPTKIQKDSRCGLRVYVKTSENSLAPSGLVEIFLNPEFQVCCTRVAPQIVNLSFMASQEHAYRFSPTNFSKLLPLVLDALKIDGELISEPIGVSGIGKYIRVPQIRNIFLLGDSVRQLDPIGGMGMSQALVSARITAETIAKVCSSTKQSAEILAAHHKRLRRSLSDLKAYTYLSYWSLASSTGKRVLGSLKTGGMAKEILLSMHRPPSWKTPTGLLSRAALFSAGRF